MLQNTHVSNGSSTSPGHVTSGHVLTTAATSAETSTSFAGIFTNAATGSTKNDTTASGSRNILSRYCDTFNYCLESRVACLLLKK